MEQHIFFFDIDGTISDGFNGGKHEISNVLKQALKQLKEKGHYIFIATGRPFAYLNDDILSCNFDGYILSNGAVAMKDGKILKEIIIPRDVVKRLVDQMEKNKSRYFLDYITEVYFSKHGSEANELFGNEVIKNGTIITDYNLDEITVTKIEINDLNEGIIEYLKTMEKEGFELVWYPRINYAEVTMPHATKGNMITEVLNMLEIPKERSIAFGDGDNDIAMFNVVGYSVAMGNGTDSIKAIADKITETCANEGIVRELQRLGFVEGIL